MKLSKAGAERLNHCWIDVARSMIQQRAWRAWAALAQKHEVAPPPPRKHPRSPRTDRAQKKRRTKKDAGEGQVLGGSFPQGASPLSYLRSPQTTANEARTWRGGSEGGGEVPHWFCLRENFPPTKKFAHPRSLSSTHSHFSFVCRRRPRTRQELGGVDQRVGGKFRVGFI